MNFLLAIETREIIITAVTLGGVAVFLIIMLIPLTISIKHNARERQERRAYKLESARLKTELAITHKRANMEMELEREAKSPRYCIYCGTRNEPGAKNCSNCGSSMQ